MGEKKKLKKRLRVGALPKAKYFEWQDIFFHRFAMVCTFFGVVALVLLLVGVGSNGLDRISWDFLSNGPSARPLRAGIFTALIGTLWMMVLTAVIAFPIGIGAAIYLEEYNKKSKLAGILEINIANLAGVPSIIYGLLGLQIFARTLMLGNSLLAGALTLALLILPVIIVSTREALRTVPYTIREASYALGASKWQTIWFQVLPASMSGIFTGVILALSRAIGETAPLVVLGAATFVTAVPTGIFDNYTVVPIQIYNWVSRPDPEFSRNAAAAIIILLMFTFVMNGIAIYLRNKSQKKIKW
ncbi:MAG: phosphate ABC transporter permease PstA [Cytophagaceae bacterium]|jgi:phosphate transport system permease protein|nr:phosphate ABC transporter permease PstA [Cytophagaceae bacterium]